MTQELQEQEIQKLRQEVEKYKQLFQQLRFAVSFLPVDKFVTSDSVDGCFVDYNKIDAADFKDNAESFSKAMCHVKCVQIFDGYEDL